MPRDNNTYIGDDGLLYCKICNTPRQCRLSDEIVVSCICCCQQAEFENIRKKERQKEINEKINRYRSIGFDCQYMQTNTFAKDDGSNKNVSKAIISYVDNFEEFKKNGRGLLLYGDVGTGKSFFAACIVNALIDKCYPCMMTNLYKITNAIASTYSCKQDYIDRLCRLSLIAIDDFGCERDTEYMNESVMYIIDSLYRAKVPIIVTSNYTPQKMVEDKNITKRRIYDRIIEICHPIKVDGESRRKEIGKSEYKNTKDILGV